MSWKTNKRFYETVGVNKVEDGFTVVLDGRPVRTPEKSAFTVPTEALAKAMAEEWDAQEEEINFDAMPISRLAGTVIDRIATRRDEVVDSILKYAGTDMLCYRVEHPNDLVVRQAKQWQPLLDWAAETHGVNLEVTTGILPLSQKDACHAALRKAVSAHDDWQMAGLTNAVQACGSLVVGLALVAGRIDADEAFEVSELEATHQIEQWGEDAEATQRRKTLKAEIGMTAAYLAYLKA